MPLVASTGPVLAHNGMFMGMCQIAFVYTVYFVLYQGSLSEAALVAFVVRRRVYNVGFTVNIIPADVLAANAARSSAARAYAGIISTLCTIPAVCRCNY